jgi:hypothetical protein
MKHKVLLALPLLLSLIACRASLRDGKVPEKFREAAAQYSGTYQGQFEGRQMDLTLSMDSDGTARLTFKDLNKDNQLIAGCQSDVGQLRYAEVSKKDKSVKGLTFLFHRGNCAVQGPFVDLEFAGKSIKVSIVKEYQLEMHHGPIVCSGPIGDRDCDSTDYDVYVPVSWLTGTFSR